MRYICFGVVLLFATAAAVAGEAEIPIGVVLPLSGPTANFGTEALRGINLAAQSVNSAGGVRGRALHLIVRDNATDPSLTSREVSQLVSTEDVMAIVGPLTSTCAAAAGAVAQEAGTPLILPTATTPYVTEIGDYVSRICFTDPFQGKALATFSRESLQADRVAIVYELGSSYSENLAEYYALQFKDRGGKVVFYQGVGPNPSGTQLKAAVDQALDVHPHVLFAPVYYPDAAIILQRAFERESPVTLLGSDGWESKELFRLSGKYIRPNRVYISSHFSIQYRQPQVEAFAKHYEQIYSEPPNAVSALGFDAVMVAADALRRSTTMDRHGLQQAIVSTNGFPGVTGVISINEKRNVIKDVFILKAEGGRFVHERAVSAD